jgi:hypothetical protein
MRMYQHAATLIAEDQLTTRSLGLATSESPSQDPLTGHQ